MKKRFFTFLMAILALLSISQVVKAADCYIMGSFNTTEAWTKLDGQNMTALSGEKYTQEYKCTTSGEYRFRFAVGGESWQLCPHTPKYNLTEAIPNYGCAYTTDNGKGDNYFYVNMESGKTYTFTFDNSNASNRNVACTVSGSTSPSEFEKLYLIGGLYNDWKDDTTRPFTTTDGRVYEYVFDSDYTNKFNQESDCYYFRVKTATSQHYQPQTNDAPVKTEFTSANPGSNIAWKLTMTKGKSYTLIFDYENKRIKYLEGVSKKIQLLNGSSEVTGSNGKYTLDLSGASSDANITLTIDGAKYRLATAQTISAAGTTSGIAFTTEGTEALTLKAGLIYSLTVAEDGKMKVVARQRGAADGSYYLVGNFFTDDRDDINYEKKYFRFINNKGDGNLYFDIPASLTVKAQVYGADGKCYGPKDNKEIGIDKPANTDDKTAKGEMVAGEGNYWSFTDRGFVGNIKQVGIYRVTIKVDEETGIPTNWSVTYDKTKRMAYFLVDPNEDIDAVAQPCYTDYLPQNESHNRWSNNFYGNIYLKAGQHCFVVGNIQSQAYDADPEKPRNTTTKLYFQGNGGLDPTTNVDGSEKDKYTKICPGKAGFVYGKTMSMVLEYNPARGHDDYNLYGIGGEILKAQTQITDQNDPITSIQIVGNGVVDSWVLDNAQDMKYNKTLDCWEYKFRTEKAESVDNKFRFIANKDWKYNWGEESLKKKDQARPYTDTDPANGHEASLKDPNELGFTKAGTQDNRNGAGTFADMYFNRPAGEWTIRFYIRTILDESGNNYKAVYAYTITGSASNDVILTYCNGQFIRTYSNNKAMNPVDDNVKIYEVYRYDKPEGTVDNIYAKGTVHLRRLNYIPANVGVVLIGVAPEGTYKENDQLRFSLLERTEDSEIAATDSCKLWTNAETYIQHGDEWNNYLVPTVQAVDNLGNAYVDKSGNITYRYFGLSNYYRTKYHQSLGAADTQDDYLGFFRLTSNGKSGANKAYLSIPANAEVGKGVGKKYGYIDFNGQLLENQYHEQYEGESPAKFANMAMVFDDLIEGNETTGIKELETEVLNDNKYYNLQGIEVAYPVKGIYIHNGKKVIVK